VHLVYSLRLFPNYLQSMMWRHVDLEHSFLPLLSIVTFWYVVHAQSNIYGSPNTSHVESIGRQYARYWWTSMWGFIVTLVVLTMDVWGVAKAMNESTRQNVVTTFITSALNPLLLL